MLSLVQGPDWSVVSSDAELLRLVCDLAGPSLPAAVRDALAQEVHHAEAGNRNSAFALRLALVVAVRALEATRDARTV